MALATERRGTAGLTITDDGEIVAEIVGPDLTSLRFRPGGPLQLSPEVPLPLHWRQYANHQDPERNAAQIPVIERVIEEEGRRVVASCYGTNRSHTVESRTSLELLRRTDPVCYELTVRTALRVRDGASWHVTPNPNHGELEFCTLFPRGTFSPDRSIPKRYQACYLQQGDAVWRIPHHHLESADKHQIAVRTNDRFLWLLEEENPCFELLSPDPIRAGLCAYMWDGHFGYSVCRSGDAIDLQGGSGYEAAYRLSALTRDQGAALAARARDRPAPGIEEIPLYCTGMNRFDRTGDAALEYPEESWPWEFDAFGAEGRPEGAIDRTIGADDRTSLRITGHGNAAARWMATTIGPAYGQEPLGDNRRFSLKAVVRTRGLTGQATIALRLHRSGYGGLFDIQSYEVFRSDRHAAGDTDWMDLQVITPPITPGPDRIHLLLEHTGSGTTWFDNVLFEEHR